ncbi:MAG: MarR family winged helix-turn-helix transcriptional regulator [Anaerolineales bacterium]|jgi:DNA-binding MarR family transcriptional regulator|nr:MarR family winged helix-turn-helix transcriptional regulator [Anaerolineales bacterium]
MSDSLLDKFWEVIPPAWFQTRAQIRTTAADQFSLTVEQFQVLRRIRRGFNSVSAIAADSRTSRPAVSKAIDGLVNRGLVSRLTDEQDRRHIHLSLTEEGARVMNGIYGETNAWLANKFAPLSPAERSQLISTLDVLQKSLKD